MSDTCSSLAATPSRNSLFSTSWTPEVRPPRPLSTSELASISTPKSISIQTNVSPLSLSRASSLRRQGPPDIGSGHPNLRDRSPLGSRRQRDEPLSPLHQSPSLVAISEAVSAWRPPRPPLSEDLELHLSLDGMHLLGEGRYAKVFLASYRRSPHAVRPSSDEEAEWNTCAVKQLAPDRDSQTLGLREAFFLNRLSGDVPPAPSTSQPDPDNSHSVASLNPVGTSIGPASIGKVYVVRLIAVKENVEETRRVVHHARAVSEAVTEGQTLAAQQTLTRQRSSTVVNRLSLGVSPSLPSMKHSLESTPALSRLVLLLEYAPGGTLDRFLRLYPDMVGEQMWKRWARQGAEALRWVHSRGILHADVKPGNLLLSSNYDLRLSDFGSSLLVHTTHPPTDGLGLGTLPFSAPELIDTSRSFSFPVDIFSFGATLYQCLTGSEPYRGNRAVEMMHYVRKGSLWTYEERARVARMFSDLEEFASNSPFPSAWRADGHIEETQPRRAGSLRVQVSGPDRHRSARVVSVESLRGHPDKLQPGPQIPDNLNSSRASEAAESKLYGLAPSALPANHRVDVGYDQEEWSLPSQADGQPGLPDQSPYADGSPAMPYLDGRGRVAEDIRAVIKDMVAVEPSDRPTADELVELWHSQGVCVGE